MIDSLQNKYFILDTFPVIQSIPGCVHVRTNTHTRKEVFLQCLPPVLDDLNCPEVGCQ